MNLLIATEFPPNASGGGPAVVRQMLKNWPAKNLVWWSCLPELDTCFGQNVHSLHCATIPRKFYPQKRFAEARAALLEGVWSPLATAHLRRTIQRTGPDAIWVIPHNWSILPTSAALAGYQGICHVTMQDYVDIHNNPQRFGQERCGRMAHMADRLYAAARTRDATSYPMIEDLKKRTGQSAAQMLHAGLETEDFDFLREPVMKEDSGSIRIAFAGTILVENVFSLFIGVLENIRRALPKPIELWLFGSHSYSERQWFNREWMIEKGNATEQELRRELRKCNWGFAPMALDDDDPRYNRFSFPTKFISYLAAGLPIIVMGHPECSLMKMTAKYHVGFCSTGAGREILTEQLRAALSCDLSRERYREEIVRCASAEFDAKRMREVLYQCFAVSAKGPR